ncbi:MAG: CRISPR-associated protein Csx3 [Dehalococcoidia bacterium]
MRYYLDKGLVVQALTLAREWVVSWAMLKRGHGNWLSVKEREDVERQLGQTLQTLLDQKAPASREIEIWDQLTQLRNSVAHCGMSTPPAKPDSIKKRAQGILDLLMQLLQDAPEGALMWGRVTIDLKSIYGDVAKLDLLPHYLQGILEQAGEGNKVVLTGQAPVWLYLAVAHALHGKAASLWYSSPVTGEVLIFDHSAE